MNIQQNEDPVVAIQVVPIIEPVEDDGDGEIVPQPEGPTDETTGWGVYTRHQSGKAVWAKDDDDETSAMASGRELAGILGVEIEPQAWKK